MRCRKPASSTSSMRSRSLARNCCAHIRARSRPWCVTCMTMAAAYRYRQWSLRRKCSGRRLGRWWSRCLGCRLADYYGQAERIAFASATAAGQYRFQHGYSHVEFIPYDGQHVPSDSRHRLYEIVGTSFWNCLLPIVRYRTGDLVRAAGELGRARTRGAVIGSAHVRMRPWPSAGTAGVPAGGAHHRHRMHAQ